MGKLRRQELKGQVIWNQWQSSDLDPDNLTLKSMLLATILRCAASRDDKSWCKILWSRARHRVDRTIIRFRGRKFNSSDHPQKKRSTNLWRMFWSWSYTKTSYVFAFELSGLAGWSFPNCGDSFRACICWYTPPTFPAPAGVQRLGWEMAEWPPAQVYSSPPSRGLRPSTSCCTGASVFPVDSN